MRYKWQTDFILFKNLSETLKTALWSYKAELKAAEQAQHQSIITDSAEEIVIVSPKPKPSNNNDNPQRAKLAQQRRIEQQKIIKKLSAQQWLQADIAKEVGVSVRTVQRFLTRPDFPQEPLRSASRERILAPYKQQILAWWNADIRRPSVLMTLLKPLGYTRHLSNPTTLYQSSALCSGSPPHESPSVHTLSKSH